MALVNHSASCHWALETCSQPSPVQPTSCRWELQAESPLCHTMVPVRATSAIHAERTLVLKSLLSVVQKFVRFGCSLAPQQNPISMRGGLHYNRMLSFNNNRCYLLSAYSVSGSNLIFTKPINQVYYPYFIAEETAIREVKQFTRISTANMQQGWDVTQDSPTPEVKPQPPFQAAIPAPTVHEWLNPR